MNLTVEEKIEILLRLRSRAERLSRWHGRRAERIFTKQLHGRKLTKWADYRSKYYMDQAAFHSTVAQNADRFMKELGLQG